MAFQNPFETHSKKYRNFGDFRVPPCMGEHATTGGRVPAQQKRHIFGKSSDFVVEGCKFSISEFRYPLREVNFIDFL